MDQNIATVRHLCPLQVLTNHENSAYPQDSGWVKRANGDYSCTYCGSIHPEQFISHLDTVITDPDLAVRAELNDRREKVYIERPGIKNASDGAMKFYLAHLKEYCHQNGIDLEIMERKLHEAFVISNQKFQKKFAPVESNKD